VGSSKESHKPIQTVKVFPDGRQLFEGEFNRAIVNGIVQELSFMNIPYYVVTPELRDVTLSTRASRANKHYTRNSFLISVHSNASNNPNVGEGSEFFCFPGSGRGRKIATIFAEEYKRTYPNRRLRTDRPNVKYKEGNYFILRRTKMPAILTENFFFTNEEEAYNILLNHTERKRIIDYHVDAIVRTFVEVFDQDLGFKG
jgi:N-acetylmuramoyl-L-alanine amidase